MLENKIPLWALVMQGLATISSDDIRSYFRSCYLDPDFLTISPQSSLLDRNNLSLKILFLIKFWTANKMKLEIEFSNLFN